ncbi:MAG TPA: hypothetical protein PK453_05610, partial [Leptospiraceae bacterium]|nr:hypothetical protein [Leptospiraceae bacterium]HNM06710.1 hypothetical protein [Leptospiraceae bacterium]
MGFLLPAPAHKRGSRCEARNLAGLISYAKGFRKFTSLPHFLFSSFYIDEQYNCEVCSSLQICWGEAGGREKKKVGIEYIDKVKYFMKTEETEKSVLCKKHRTDPKT